jgi:hypothetical protein
MTETITLLRVENRHQEVEQIWKFTVKNLKLVDTCKISLLQPKFVITEPKRHLHIQVMIFYLF